MKSQLYDQDFFAWTKEQSALLRDQQWQSVDLENLIEEIESLGKHQRQELKNRLGILIGHLLKWQFQPDRRGKSWQITIRLQRQEIMDLISESPSLKPYLDEAILKAYLPGLALAISETPLTEKDLPKECPYSLAQILDLEFPPDLLSKDEV